MMKTKVFSVHAESEDVDNFLSDKGHVNNVQTAGALLFITYEDEGGQNGNKEE